MVNQTTNGKPGQPHASGACSPWCDSWLKRACDVSGAIILLVLLAIPMAAIALAVKLTSRGPVFFRQLRPGKNGVEFSIFKFRTMTDGSGAQGPVLTRGADPRVTKVGQFLRKWKLDEFPQLLNVLRGEMSFVGPRPQPTKLCLQPSIQNEAVRVLSVRPGITSQATVNFRNEEDLLAPFSAAEVEAVYIRTIMPVKLRMEMEYLQNASFASDLRLVFRTVFRVLHRQKRPSEVLRSEHLPVAEQEEIDGVGEEHRLLLAKEPASTAGQVGSSDRDVF